MCTRPTVQDFITIHHELGHIQYYQQYAHQVSQIYLYAGDGYFSLSSSVMVPILHSTKLLEIHYRCLHGIATFSGRFSEILRFMLCGQSYWVSGSLKTFICDQQSEFQNLNRLMKIALAKIPFLAYSLSLEKFRWKVFRHGFNNQAGFQIDFSGVSFTMSATKSVSIWKPFWGPSFVGWLTSRLGWKVQKILSK